MASDSPSRRNRSRSKGSRQVLRSALFTLSVVAVFLLGVFVVGPLLSHSRQGAVKTVATVAPPDLDPGPVATPDVPARRPSAPMVTITEGPAEAPAAPSADATPEVTDNQPKSPKAADTTNDLRIQPPDTLTDQGQSKPVTVEPKAPASEPTAPAASKTEPLYRVRAGLFADRNNAESFAAELAAKGFSPALSSIERDGRVFFAVQAGAFRNRSGADTLAAQLKKAGFPATILADNP